MITKEWEFYLSWKNYSKIKKYLFSTCTMNLIPFSNMISSFILLTNFSYFFRIRFFQFINKWCRWKVFYCRCYISRLLLNCLIHLITWNVCKWNPTNFLLFWRLKSYELYIKLHFSCDLINPVHLKKYLNTFKSLWFLMTISLRM